LEEEPDVVLLDMMDVYRTLPLKLKLGYEWALQYQFKPNWIMKTDDDTVVRVETLEDYLEKTYNAKDNVIIGGIKRGWGVPRSGKWKELTYKPSKYPAFPLGSIGHVVSRPVAQYIIEHKKTLFEYQGEDISIGIWMNESPLDVIWVTSKHFTNHGKCSDTSKWVIGHNISPNNMKQCYDHKDEIVSKVQATASKEQLNVRIFEKDWDIVNSSKTARTTSRPTLETCPFTPPSTTQQHNGGWMYTKALIQKEHVAFDKGFGNSLVEYFGNATVYDIGAGVGQFEVFSQGSSVRTWAFDGGNNIELMEGVQVPVRKDPNYVIPKVCWIDASVPLTMEPKDWVISIEVGEHIAKAKESIFIDNLVKLAIRGVILTWAIKGQGGHQHINEQNNEYIIHEMNKRGMRYDRAQSMRFRNSVTWWPWLRNTVMVFHKQTATSSGMFWSWMGVQLFV
jgi:hypothetical protein